MSRLFSHKLEARVLKKPKQSAPGRRLRRRWTMRLFFLALLAVIAVCALYGTWAGFCDLGSLQVMPQRTAIYDCNGNAFSRRAGEDRIVVPLSKVSPRFIDALLAREDTRFYRHCGIDAVGIARAVIRNAIHLRAREGASTLTQQLARNSFDLGGRNLHRKLLEAFVALRIERSFSKAQILECYVNRIYYGAGVFGVETASRTYFDKPSANLTLGEAAMLAGLIRSPSRFSPFHNPQGALRERDTVLDRMAAVGKITAAQAAQAKAQPVALSTARPPTAGDGYAMGLIEEALALNLDSDQLAAGGLRVYTTLDPALQKTAEAALDAELTKVEERPGYAHPKRADFGGRTDGAAKTPYLQGALLMLDNATGGIRAIVGGRNYAESTYNRVYARRPVGSTFKPFVYAAAYASGRLTPTTPVSDDPIRRREIAGAPNWTPGNSDGTFRGLLPAEEGLVLSRNTMSARVGNLAGLDAVRGVANAAGLGPAPEFPSIYLGSFECSLRDLVSAYTLFPNGGVRRQPYLISRVEDARGKTIYQASAQETRALSPGVCWMVTAGLQKVMERGTGASANFRGTVAGKTGTTNDYKDAWFVGYTRTLTCGVWVGLDEPAPIAPHGYGAALALPVWCDVMNAASERYASRGFAQPEAVVPEVVRPGDAQSGGAPRKAFPSRLINSVRHLFGGGD
ncbi:MAG: PBP1A family penicillin-binding protein [Chthoniobacteraceae bacterium]|nr:PBP1A family penicillin-binding protein [Chthoniobacteraceae bacterium]